MSHNPLNFLLTSRDVFYIRCSVVRLCYEFPLLTAKLVIPHGCDEIVEIESVLLATANPYCIALTHTHHDAHFESSVKSESTKAAKENAEKYYD